MSTEPTPGPAPSDSEPAVDRAPETPLEGAREAIAAARERLTAAAAALAGGGDDPAGPAIEAASGSATEVARALWLLRRAAGPSE